MATMTLHGQRNLAFYSRNAIQPRIWSSLHTRYNNAVQHWFIRQSGTSGKTQVQPAPCNGLDVNRDAGWWRDSIFVAIGDLSLPWGYHARATLRHGINAECCL